MFPKPPSRRDGVIASFKDSLKLVSIADDEFHTEIDPAFKMGKKLRGRVGKFTVCVKASFDIETDISISLGGIIKWVWPKH